MLKILGSKRHTLIQSYTVADNCSGTNNNTGSVVNAEMVAYDGRRVYVDTGYAMGSFGNESGKYRYSKRMQYVCCAVIQHFFQAGIAKYYLPFVHSCWVIIPDGFHIT